MENIGRFDKLKIIGLDQDFLKLQFKQDAVPFLIDSRIISTDTKSLLKDDVPH